MSKQYIFIDDSGNPGTADLNTTHFIIAAVVISSQQNLQHLTGAINKFRLNLGWHESREFKFNTTKKDTVKNLFLHLKNEKFHAYAAVIDKTKIISTTKLSPKENLYDYTIKQLLIKLNLSNITIVIDGKSHKKHAEKVRTYLRQALKQKNIRNCRITFVDSRKEPLIQLADLIAGSISRSLSKTKTDHQDYIQLLHSHLKKVYKTTP